VINNLSSRFSYIFKEDDKYPGSPSIKTNLIEPDKAIVYSGIKVIPIDYLHAKLQVYGYRINDFAYLTDLKTINRRELDKLNNLDVLVLNCIRIKEHFSHLNLKEALDLISIIKPKKTYLTHISHLLGFHEEVSKTLPENVFLSYDGLTLNIS
jgi:phosphoribosyl 1,2-cyclic phosphate phosphodiesterase